MNGLITHVRRHPWLTAGILLSAAFIGSLFIPLPAEKFRRDSVQSLRVVDRYGTLLREYLNDADGRGQWRSLTEIAPGLRAATVAVEDRRFFLHPGVDPMGIVRALADRLRSSGVRSGGSTLTQQVIRNVYHLPRTVPFKLIETWYALRLERMMSKDAILEQYLNRAPYGNQLFGAEAASRTYFGKPAADLSLAEGAFLAALPNAPAALNPYRNPAAALDRQKLVLRRMRAQSWIGEDEYARALVQPIAIIPQRATFRAPHAVDVAVRMTDHLPASTIATTIDAALQERVEGTLRSDLRQLRARHVTNAAVVVLENATGAVRAFVGSADYFDDEHQGQVDGALALRQPGSALKPFTYALALERGATAADVLADIPVGIPDDRGEYSPENYDRRYRGPVRLRIALACSYNIPAVRTLQALGGDALLQRLHAIGLTMIAQPASYYGYGLTLGNAEVDLIDLTNAYAALARDGRWQPMRLVDSVVCADGRVVRPSQSDPPPRRVIDEHAAFLVTDILSDPVARRPAFGGAFRFPFPCAVKTGTSKDYRDNWAMGYTPSFTVGVWAGNFDGSPMRGVSGVTGAGPILVDVMMGLGMRERPGESWPVPPDMERRTVCAVSGLRPSDNCPGVVTEWFVRGSYPKAWCDVHRRYRYRDADGRSTERVFEILPPEYHAWAQAERLPSPARDAVRISRDGTALSPKRPGLAILSPQDGDVFRIDPVLRPEYQSIRVMPSGFEGLHGIVLRVDSAEFHPLGRNGVLWTLRRGSHQFVLEAAGSGGRYKSPPITIHVQ